MQCEGRLGGGRGARGRSGSRLSGRAVLLVASGPRRRSSRSTRSLPLRRSVRAGT